MLIFVKESKSHRKLSVSVEKTRKMTKTNEKIKLNLKPEEKKFENIIKYNNHQWILKQIRVFNWVYLLYQAIQNTWFSISEKHPRHTWAKIQKWKRNVSTSFLLFSHARLLIIHRKWTKTNCTSKLGMSPDCFLFFIFSK